MRVGGLLATWPEQPSWSGRAGKTLETRGRHIEVVVDRRRVRPQTRRADLVEDEGRPDWGRGRQTGSQAGGNKQGWQTWLQMEGRLGPGGGSRHAGQGHVE